STRALPFLGLLAGLITGCAHAAGSGERADEGDAEPSSTVTAQDIQGTPNEPIEKALMARVPGVWIERTPDGGIAVRIRGSTTIQGNRSPLYVVDGLAIKTGPNGSLTGINPYDIESIEVLKDAAAITMYGARGANGVILVKMKRSRQRRA
ncbi:MAG: TonB-dependent receptor plug domain-containing protein, partial [Longimicrobiales bacterium]